MTTFDLQGIGMTSARTRKRLIERLREAGIKDNDVLNAMFSVPRHIFVDEALAHRAYEDTALPIGHSQTISQPYIVARCRSFLREKGPGRVLEVGTGSGYQARHFWPDWRSRFTRRAYRTPAQSGDQAVPRAQTG